MATNGSPPAADAAVANGGGVSSPQSRRRSLHSPWASVVRGDSEQNPSPTAAAAAAAAAATVSPGSSSSPPVEETSVSDNSLIEIPGSEPQPESSENNGEHNAGGQRRPAWNRPVNGVVEPVSVMGGASWPTLSETIRSVPRSASESVSNGSAPSQAPIISQPSHRLPNNSDHGNHGNSVGNNPSPVRPRSRNRGGAVNSPAAGSGPSQSTFNQPSLPMPPPFPVVEVPYAIFPTALDNSVRGPRPIGGAATQSHNGTDHSSQRSNSRRIYGGRSRRDGQYHNNHGGGRRDQDRRDVHTPQYVHPPMGFMPPPLPPGAAPFMSPPPMRVFPQMFDVTPPLFYVPPIPPESFRTMPIVPPLPPVILPPNEPLSNMIVKQIDFYFSDNNLVKDSFLRSNMDDHGWVSVALIASFRRVQQLTKDIALILESLKYSVVVEVEGDKVRRWNEWNKWLLSSSVVNSDSSAQASSSTVVASSTSEQEVSVDDPIAHVNGNVDASEAYADESSSHHGLVNGDNTEEVHSRSL